MSYILELILKDWIFTCILFVMTFILTFMLMKKHRAGFKLPPGPLQWPLIGNLPQIFGKDLHLALTNFGKDYGSLVWLRMGGENVLVVNTMDAAVSSFVRQGKIFSGRPKKRKTVDVLLGTGRDIIMSDASPELRFHRKIVHSFLASQTKKGKSHLEDLIMNETRSLSDKLEEFWQQGKAFDPKLDISRVVANVLCMCILNRRFEDTGDAFMNQLRIVQDIVDNIESFNIVDVLPFLEHFPIPSWRRFLQSLKRRDVWLAEVLKGHRDTRRDDHDRDLLDILLKLQQEAEDKNDVDQLGLLSDVNIGHIVYELFGGGIESTTVSILWFIIYMLRNPLWQQRVYEELKAQTGEDGLPRPFDRHRYPVLESTIKETLRIAAVLPVGFPHRTMSDTQVNGYHIPSDTMVLMNIWSIHHDDQAWQDPYTFNPGRFLGECPNERYSYLPFGVGNRVCLGSTISKMEIFMFTACLLSKYEIVSPVDECPPDTTGLSGLTIRPKPFKILLKKRT